MRDSDRADHRARAGDRECRSHRLVRPDTLEGGVDADTVGHRHDSLGRGVAALGEDVGGAELARQRLAGGVPRQRDDPGGAEAFGRDDRAQADGSVADDRDSVARFHAATDRGVVACAHHIRQRE